MRLLLGDLGLDEALQLPQLLLVLGFSVVLFGGGGGEDDGDDNNNSMAKTITEKRICEWVVNDKEERT